MYNVDRVYPKKLPVLQISCITMVYGISLWFAAKTKLQLISLDSVVSRNQIHPLNINKSVMLSVTHVTLSQSLFCILVSFSTT